MDLPALDQFGRQLLPGLRQSLQKPGALVLCDQFTPGAPEEPAHGTLVAQVVAQQGFAGQVLALPFEDPGDERQARWQSALQRSLQGWGEAATPEAVRQNLYETMVLTRLNAVDTACQRVLALTQAGARNAVLNLSVGSSAAMCVASVLPLLADAQARAQLSLAFGDGVAAGLVETATRSSQDSRLLAARREFAAVVERFEAQHNSVVLAAGNDGTLSRKLGLEVPAGFARSDLITPETTVVGALQGDRLADYTSDPESVTVFAPGTAYLPALRQAVHGTSFAAPVVAAAMAELHRQGPEWTSTVVERRLSGLNGA